MEKNKNKSRGKILKKLLITAVLVFGLVFISGNVTYALEENYDWGDLGQDIKKETGEFVKEDIPSAIRGIFSGEKKPTTSFVDFEGGLAPPSGKGLAPELTRVTSAREFILNVTNFALSFLGLIAMLVIIYGGVLYVTARGNEEQAGKGKKSIEYAVIGIVVILISFALVNTLLRAAEPGFTDRLPPEQFKLTPAQLCDLGVLDNTICGTDLKLEDWPVLCALDKKYCPPETEKKPGEEGQQRSAGAATLSSNLPQGRIFNLAALEISSSLNNFIRLYQNYAIIDRILRGLKDFTEPRGALEVRSFLSGVESAINTIKSHSSATHASYTAANKVLDDFVYKWQRLSMDDLESLFMTEEEKQISEGIGKIGQPVRDSLRNATRQLPFIPAAKALSEEAFKGFYDGGKGQLHDAFKKALDDNFYSKDPQPHKKDFSDEIEKILERLGKVNKGLDPLANAPAENYIRKGITSEEELRKALEGIPPDFTVKQAFEEGLKALETAKDMNADDIVKVKDVVDKVGRLYLVVQDIKFMAVQINASTVEGNAPLGVTFTSIGSLDPSGLTIEDAQHLWDLDGNGQTNEDLTALGCKEIPSVSISCVYALPGTYRVTLRLDPKKDATQTAAGIATITIKVNPPSSRIYLAAQMGDITEVLHEYDEKGKVKIAKNTYTITLDEAKAGVKYDATKTTDGGGLPAGITNYEWIFGDQSTGISGPNANLIDNPKKTYGRTGLFPLKLEVSDKNTKKDRIFVNVVVTSIAARILAPTLRGDLNTTFIFDGSRSKSDLGPIDSFEWKISDKDGKELTDIKNNVNDTFRYAFKNPGNYTVKLKIADKAGNEAQADVSVAVESRKPTAEFEIKGCVAENLACLDPTKPSIIELDASKSFDPDAGDKLAYEWEIVGATEVNDFEILEGKLKDADSSKTKVIKIKFKKTGKFTVKLTVNDQHEDESLRKNDTKEKEIQISSAVDLSWAAGMPSAQKLGRDGKAEFTFEAQTTNAEDFVIDFGDNSEKEEGQVSGNKIEIKHTYGDAKSYPVTLTAKSKDFGSTTIQRRFHVSTGDAPLPVIKAMKNGQELFIEEGQTTTALRKQDIFTFDAGDSINTKGTKEGLKYSWDFGDGIRSSGEKPTHTYENVSPADPGFFEVSLTVLEEDASTGLVKSGETKLKLNVIGAKPTLTSLTNLKKSEGEETPLDFDLKVEGAKDLDGQITEYTFWYYDEIDPERKLGVVTTAQPSALITVETKGDAGEEKKYSFCVEMKDNENNISTCKDLFPDEKTLPFAVVKNGPNKSPTVDIRANRTSINIGESVTLTAAASDQDGRVVKYIWDVLGDGFHNDSETELSEITQKYDVKSLAGGYRVRAKVIDDQGSAGFSNELAIYVSSPFNPPIVDFDFRPVSGGKIQFKNLSRPAPGSNATLSKFTWDFDTGKEFCTERPNACPDCKGEGNALCDHEAGNDPDSTEKNPTHEYPNSGPYEVRLIVEDSNDQSNEIMKIIQVNRGAAPENAPIKAVLRIDAINGRPASKGTDGRYHLQGNGATVTFFFGDSRGNIFEYVLDKNIHFDSDALTGGGDGHTDNDRDFVTDDGTKEFTSTYLRSFHTEHPEGLFTARLSIFGKDPQNRIISDVTAGDEDAIFVFDAPTGAAALFTKFGTNTAILLGLLGGVILALMGYGIAIFGRRGKPRSGGA